ncbi:hypothetical protein CYLTODRAFT_422238 [Cylindrobasidium torrendii FP15055 ss-10]|uniref:Zn(2)-C6 fungal-type domain-containing protein n=1 Tax=Cylindrobasidium torrendii FP15055 ss-10 TaxID=1314674 RepID=A0A0D7BDX1_9AGAR|nr:hypothetical protein CYLTODRAFT_422238 [Cylindrobasidium torrendii FP15055 ss-10]
MSTPPESPAGRKKTTKRRKVNHACLYCRRSHMTCDEGRPCQRCIKREIGHLCHDEDRRRTTPQTTPQPTSSTSLQTAAPAPPPLTTPSTSQATLTIQQQPQPFLYNPSSTTTTSPDVTLGNEFSVLTDFLETLDERPFFSDPPPTSTPLPSAFPAPAAATAEEILPSATKTEKFLLTAADQSPGSRDERLNRVIRSKYEAGLLKPYNYVKGYARLSRWMDRNVSQESKQQILQPLSVLRPKFRAVAQSLRDIDLVFIEEAFERLLLDYDRVFSAMGVPACLWRRTGEIYKSNREFAELVGVDGWMMREGRLCIYELMAEESAVNYWEKYGHVAFDSSQKAVLTSCVLRYKPVLSGPAVASNTSASGVMNGLTAGIEAGTTEPSLPENGQVVPEVPTQEALVNCCFSFTIRRDKWGIPSMIVGNFIRC